MVSHLKGRGTTIVKNHLHVRLPSQSVGVSLSLVREIVRGRDLIAGQLQLLGQAMVVVSK